MKERNAQMFYNQQQKQEQMNYGDRKAEYSAQDYQQNEPKMKQQRVRPQAFNNTAAVMQPMVRIIVFTFCFYSIVL